MDVRMPDGTIIKNVPEGVTRSQLSAKLGKMNAPTQRPEESNWNLENLGESALRGLKQRGAGVLELGSKLAESAGLEIPDEYRHGISDIQNQYTKEGQGTGTVGLIGEIAGDPLSYIPIGGGAKNVVKGLAGAGALSGITTGTGDADSSLQDMAQNAAIQAGTGAIAGKIMQKLMRPLSSQLDDVAAKNVALLEREGVKLQPSQKTGSKTLNLMEEALKGLPFTSGKQARISEGQLKQFTKAALKRAGVDAELATPEVMEQASKILGKKFETLIQKSGGIKVDDELLTALAAADSEATRRLGSDSVGRMVHSYIDDILATGGKLDAKTYQNTRSTLGRIAKGTQDPLLANTLMDLRSALDDAANRSISPALGKMWQKTRKEYAAYKTIESAMRRVGQEAVSGYITPANLLNAVKTGNKQFARGAGELNALARAGKDVVTSSIPDSGTATRTMMQNVLTGGGLATAGGISGGFPAVAGALAAPRVIQEIYNVPPIQRYIANGVTDSAVPAVLAGKAAIQGARQEQTQPIQPEPQQPLPPQSSNVLERIMGGESGGNPNAQNPNSSASGLYQITNGTWKQYAKKLNLPLDAKNNPQAQEAVAQALLADNASTLQSKLKRQPTDNELILAHFAGAGGALNMIRNPNKPAVDVVRRPPPAQRTKRNDPVLANKQVFYDGNKPRTGQEVLIYLANR